MNISPSEHITGSIQEARRASTYYFCLVARNRNRLFDRKAWKTDETNPTPSCIKKYDLTNSTVFFEFGGGERRRKYSLELEKRKDEATFRNDANGNVYEIFVQQPYKKLHVEGSIVLDIGSASGDTAIYFHARGAKKILMFDISKEKNALAKKALKVNRIGNAEVMGSGLGDGLTIDTIMAGIPSSERIVMKSDTEGYEYKMFAEASIDALQRLDEIVIEYHYGYKDIEKKLREAGFKVEHTKPRISNKMRFGILYAKRAQRTSAQNINT